MTSNNFSISILVEQTPAEVFRALRNPEQWWPGEIKGSAQNLNDEFTYRYEDFHSSTQRVIEMIPDRTVVWLVTDSVINYVDDKREWTGTKVVFDIVALDAGTELRFTHIGLEPSVECYESCSNAWSRIINESLLELITTGKPKKIVLA